jgi:hypothetical protein
MNFTSNPYGMEMASGLKQEKPGTSSSNRSGISGENKNPAVTQSNQMIAKIYGKSTKFVVNNSGNGSYINDQYKKPKI